MADEIGCRRQSGRAADGRLERRRAEKQFAFVMFLAPKFLFLSKNRKIIGHEFFYLLISILGVDK